MNTMSPRALKTSLHLDKAKKKRIRQTKKALGKNPPKPKKWQSMWAYYKEQADINGLIDKAESLIDTAIMEAVLEGKYKVEVGLIHTWSWSQITPEWFQKHIVSILENRSCTNISINESEIKRWLTPEKRSGITFSTKGMLKKKEKKNKK